MILFIVHKNMSYYFKFDNHTFFTLNTATFIDSVKNNKRYHFVYLIRHYTNYTSEVFECAHFLCISNYSSYFLYFHSLFFITYFYVYILLRFFVGELFLMEAQQVTSSRKCDQGSVTRKITKLGSFS